MRVCIHKTFLNMSFQKALKIVRHKYRIFLDFLRKYSRLLFFRCLDFSKKLCYKKSFQKMSLDYAHI
jgi:hypothetical protein